MRRAKVLRFTRIHRIRLAVEHYNRLEATQIVRNTQVDETRLSEYKRLFLHLPT
jgi:hypothetical protein